jgi:hypothetical protein
MTACDAKQYSYFDLLAVIEFIVLGCPGLLTSSPISLQMDLGNN